MEQPTQTYADWKSCITSGGGIRTVDAVRGRIEILSDPSNEETRRFVATYGNDRLQRILEWLNRLQKEL